MGFFPTYANHDVWMQDPTDPTSMYDYVVVYVDNLFASMSDPPAFFQALQSPPWSYKLKGVSKPHYHLGTDFFCHTDGTLCMGTQTYIKQPLANYEKSFGDLPHPAFFTLAT